MVKKTKVAVAVAVIVNKMSLQRDQIIKKKISAI